MIIDSLAGITNLWMEGVCIVMDKVTGNNTDADDRKQIKRIGLELISDFYYNLSLRFPQLSAYFLLHPLLVLKPI